MIGPPRIKVEHFDYYDQGYRIIATVTTVHDPDAVEAAQAFRVRCLARRLPEILAAMAAETEELELRVSHLEEGIR